MLAVILSLALFQTPEKTALIIDGRTVIVSVTEAEKEFEQLDNVKHRTRRQRKRHAALVQALGVRQTYYSICDGPTGWCETVKSCGRRLPLQGN